MNPVAALSHLAAIVLGVFGAIWLVGELTPELPDESVDPAVEVPVPVGPESPESLFQAGPLSTAIFQLEDQLGDGVEYAFLTITPTELTVSEVEVDGGVEPSDLSTGEPQRVIEVLEEKHGVAAEQVRQLDVVATTDGLAWVVNLDSTAPGVSATTHYVVPYGSEEVQAGGPLPDPLVPR